MLIIRNKPLQGHINTIHTSRDFRLLGLDHDQYRGICVSVLEDFDCIPETACKIILARADYDTIDVPKQFLEYIGSYTLKTAKAPLLTYHAFLITDAAAASR